MDLLSLSHGVVQFQKYLDTMSSRAFKFFEIMINTTELHFLQ